MTEDLTGQDWTAAELDLVVADYVRMLQAELAGETYSKTEHRTALMQLIGRNKGSIEFKHQNISAVLQEIGLPWIDGYKPRSNYQSALFSAIERQLEANPGLLQPLPHRQPKAINLVTIIVPAPTNEVTATNKALVRLIRRFDPAARDASNRKLGKAGEEFVLNIERWRLAQSGNERLAERVRWISHEDGDGAGYDIHSFDRAGNDRLLEVKTTCGAERTPFYITRNELSLSDERPNEFRLMRVHSFANDPKIFELAPPLTSHVSLEPTNYLARWPVGAHSL